MCLSCKLIATDIYSTSNTGVTLKSGLGVVRGYREWR